MIAIGYEYFQDDVPEEDKEYNDLLESKTVELLEEELRILYVALTRPEHMLILQCDNPKTKLIQYKRLREYASWAKWISEIDGGQFLEEHIWHI
jgi:ATP-dependent exoDNAse (exonuclease V) beta subunit